MNKLIAAYQQNELMGLSEKLKALTAANEALCSSNANLMKANKQINAAHVLLKERICALGCLLLALGIGFVVLLPL